MPPIMADGLVNDIHETAKTDEEPVRLTATTDEEAELLLPGYQIAFEEYHIFRLEGATPDEALKKTLAEWRTLWAATAYVPHRRPA